MILIFEKKGDAFMFKITGNICLVIILLSGFIKCQIEQQSNCYVTIPLTSLDSENKRTITTSTLPLGSKADSDCRQIGILGIALNSAARTSAPAQVKYTNSVGSSVSITALYSNSSCTTEITGTKKTDLSLSASSLYIDITTGTYFPGYTAGSTTSCLTEGKTFANNTAYLVTLKTTGITISP